MTAAPAATRSVLLRRVVPGAAPGPWVVALHDDGGDADELVPLCRAAAPGLPVCALQAPRSRNPFLGSGHAPWRAYAGYAWFRRDDAGRPEATSLADALAQLERVAAELAAGGAPLLFGRGDGATLALAAAARFPGRLGGVVVVGGRGAVAAAAPPVLRLPADADAAAVAGAVARWLAHQQEVSRGRG